MGFPLTSVGISLTPNHGAAQSSAATIKPPQSHFVQPRTGSQKAHTPQTAASPATQGSASNGGFYQVADAVILQLQIQNISLGGGVAGANSSPTNATQTNAAGGGAVAANTAASNTAAVTASASNLQTEEQQLQAALQELGLSPGAIQEFMSIGRLLAQVAPTVLQNFVAQMVYLAKAAQAGGASSSTPAQPAGTPVASNAAAAPQFQLEIASVQLAEVQVQVTQSKNGGTLNIAAEAGAVNIENIQISSPQTASTPTAAQNSAPNSGSSPAAAKALSASA